VLGVTVTVTVSRSHGLTVSRSHGLAVVKRTGTGTTWVRVVWRSAAHQPVARCAVSVNASVVGWNLTAPGNNQD
jgi:hypothetical protein